MIADERWRNNWRAVSPAQAVRVELPRSAAKRRATARTLRDLPMGTPVVLCASAPGALGRCRRFASKAGIELEREYLAFPSAAAPAYLVEDAPAPVRVFVKTVLVTPPKTRFTIPIDVCLSVLRTLNPRLLIRAVAPGRVAVGSRK